MYINSDYVVIKALEDGVNVIGSVSYTTSPSPRD